MDEKGLDGTSVRKRVMNRTSRGLLEADLGRSGSLRNLRDEGKHNTSEKEEGTAQAVVKRELKRIQGSKRGGS